MFFPNNKRMLRKDQRRHTHKGNSPNKGQISFREKSGFYQSPCSDILWLPSCCLTSLIDWKRGHSYYLPTMNIQVWKFCMNKLISLDGLLAPTTSLGQRLSQTGSKPRQVAPASWQLVRLQWLPTPCFCSLVGMPLSPPNMPQWHINCLYGCLSLLTVWVL